MAYCLKPLPQSAIDLIHEMLEELTRLDFVQKRGGTPTAQAMKLFNLSYDEIDSDYTTIEGYAVIAMKLRLDACDESVHIRKHYSFLKLPCDEGHNFTGACMFKCNCTKVHRSTPIQVNHMGKQHTLVRPMTQDEWRQVLDEEYA